MPRFLYASPLLLALTLLVGCDMLGGGDSAEKQAAAREADGKAIGGACRHAGRAIEDCYSLNRKADKASVFAGWRDMNDYMRENKIDAVAPQLAATQVANAKQAEPKGDAKADAHAEPKTMTDAPAEVADKRPAKAGAKPREAKPHDS